MSKYSLLILFLIAFVTGCTPQAKKLQTISLGMTKKEVIKEIGDPRVARGSIRNKFNQIIEVWEYRFALPSDDSAGEAIGKGFITVFSLGMGAILYDTPVKDYWLYFVEEKLERWGEAGDWQVEQQNIYEIRFGTGNKL